MRAKNPDFLADLRLVPPKVQPIDLPPAVMTKAPRPFDCDGFTVFWNANTFVFETHLWKLIERPFDVSIDRVDVDDL
jgi:hypothetical protein